MKLNLKFIKKNGRKSIVILSYKEFRKLMEIFYDAQDLIELKKAMKRERKKPSIPLEKVKQMFNGNVRCKK